MRLKVADPAKGIVTYSKDEFEEHWISSASLPLGSENEPEGEAGIALLPEPTPKF